MEGGNDHRDGALADILMCSRYEHILQTLSLLLIMTLSAWAVKYYHGKNRDVSGTAASGHCMLQCSSN